MNKFLKILNIMSMMIFLIMLALMLIFAPMVKGYKPAVILTGSMEPSYPVKSVVYYKNIDFKDITLGDAVIYKKSKALITHRVVEKNEESGYVITKGDANNTEDSYEVMKDEILGVVHFMVPFIGYIALIIQKKAIFIILISILILNIALGKLYEEDEKEEKILLKSEK